MTILVEALVIARKELTELARQPKVLLLIVLGPFVVLAAFGVGYRNEEVALRTVFVGPLDSPYEEAVNRYADAIEAYIVPVAFTSDFLAAADDLRADRTDIVIVLPPGVEAATLEGRRSEIAVIHNSIDPIEQIGIDFATEVAVRELNATVVSATLDELLATARTVDNIVDVQLETRLAPDERAELDDVRALVDKVLELEAGTLARPFTGDAESLVRTFVRPEQHVAPGATGLLIQHLGVSIAALSLVRDDRRGLLTDYRLGPASVVSVMLGKLLSLSGITLVAGSLMTSLQVAFLDIPFRGSVLDAALVLIGLATASVSFGLALATLSRSELYATQSAMIVLLIALFFSGFLLDLDRIRPPFDAIANIIPAAPAIAALRNIQLRGTGSGSAILVLAIQSILGMGAASLLLARRWRTS